MNCFERQPSIGAAVKTMAVIEFVSASDESFMNARPILLGIVTLVLSVLNVWAADPQFCANCGGTAGDPLTRVLDGPNLTTLKELAKNPGDPCLSEARALFNQYFPGKGQVVQQTIAGIKMQGSAEILGIARLVFDQQPQKDALRRASKCEDVLCALTEVYGSEEAALRAMVIAKRDGFALSISQHYFNGIKSQILHSDFYGSGWDKFYFSNPKVDAPKYLNASEVIWTADEIRTMERVLRVLPPQLRHLARLKSMMRIPYGVIFGARLSIDSDPEGEYLPGRPATFPISVPVRGPFLQPNSAPGGVLNAADLFHELAHQLQSLKFTQGQDWEQFKSFSNWGKTAKGEYTNDPTSCFASKYAASTTYFEDFSESARAFLTRDAEFEKNCTQKYAFMRDRVFPGFTPQPIPQACDAAKN